MDEHANRVLAYMAQTADEEIEFKKGGPAELVAYFDSDWAVSHSTTGFCITFGGAAVSYGSKRQHCISLSSTEAEIVSPHRTPPRKSSTFAASSRKWGSSSASPRPCTSTTRATSSCPSTGALVNVRGMLIDAT
eukprot:4994684-Pleurochrysis_carterae.AAC.1